MTVKFRQTIISFWFFLSYLITTVFLLVLERSVDFKISFWCHRFRPKYQQQIWQIFALEFEKWWNHKIKALYNVFNTLKSPYVNCSIIRKCLYFVDFNTFQILGQKLSKIFVGILVETMTPQGHFEINWPFRVLRIIRNSHIFFPQWANVNKLKFPIF